DAGAEEVDHFPEPITLAAVDHFQRLQPAKRRVWGLQPFPDRAFPHDFAERVRKPSEFGQPAGDWISRRRSFFQRRQRSDRHREQAGKLRLSQPQLSPELDRDGHAGGRGDTLLGRDLFGQGWLPRPRAGGLLAVGDSGHGAPHSSTDRARASLHYYY